MLASALKNYFHHQLQGQSYSCMFVASSTTLVNLFVDGKMSKPATITATA